MAKAQAKPQADTTEETTQEQAPTLDPVAQIADSCVKVFALVEKVIPSNYAVTIREEMEKLKSLVK